MKLDYVPLLYIQRELQGVPRGMGRFRQYLRTIFPDGKLSGCPARPTGELDLRRALPGSFPGANGIANASVTSLSQLDRVTGNPYSRVRQPVAVSPSSSSCAIQKMPRNIVGALPTCYQGGFMPTQRPAIRSRSS
jgi:hypothetical protein